MEAIRVRNRKAVITAERCIDCAECVRNCVNHAARATVDNLKILGDHKYNVALVSTPLFAQFKNLHDPNILLTAILKLGFDDVFEVAVGSEILANRSKDFIATHQENWPYLSTNCPAVVRLVRMRFPNLADHLLPLRNATEISAQIALKKALDATGLPEEDIGIIHIAPCPAHVAFSHEPLGIKSSHVTGNLSIKGIYPLLLREMPNVRDNPQKLSHASSLGVGERADGVSGSSISTNCITANGVSNVVEILEELEDDKIVGYDYLDLYTCNGGCVGGMLNVENPYIARADLRSVREAMPESTPKEDLPFAGDISWTSRIRTVDVYRLGDTMSESLQRLAAAEKIESEFPGLDCGSCGAPTCRALAEDIVRGKAFKNDCIYFMRDHIHSLTLDLNMISDEINATISGGNGHPTKNQIEKLQHYITQLWAELNELDSRFKQE
jgi:ferredoxin